MNETRTSASVRPAEVLHDLRGVPVAAADAVGAGRTHHLGAEQVRLRRLAGPRRTAGGDHHDAARVDQPGGDRRDHRQRGDRRVAARGRRSGWRGAAVRAGRRAPAGRRATNRRARPRRTSPTPRRRSAGSRHRSRSRRSRPEEPWRSRPTGRAAAPGRPRRARPAPRPWSAPAPGPARGTRCGWSAPSISPALDPAVTAPISTSGCDSSSRSTSPPAYPLAPATATLRFDMCMTIQSNAYSVPIARREATQPPGSAACRVRSGLSTTAVASVVVVRRGARLRAAAPPVRPPRRGRRRCPPR